MRATLRRLMIGLALLMIQAAGHGQAKVVRAHWPDMVTGSFRGRLVDPAGKPLAGGKVAVLAARHTSSWLRPSVDESTPHILQLTWQNAEDSGRFSIAHEDLVVRELDGGQDPFGYGAEEFDPHLMASAPGCATRAIPAVAWDGGEIDLGDVVLEPGVTVSGRLLDERGRPVANELVWVDNSARPRSIPPQIASRETLTELHGARTDAEGVFRVSGLWPGEVRTVRCPGGGFERLNEEWVVVEPGQLLDIGDRTITPALPAPATSSSESWRSPVDQRPHGTSTIRGYARLASGEPAAGEWLAVMAAAKGDERGEEKLLTIVRCDARGAYVVRDWPAGQWTLRSQPGGLASVTLGEGETREVDIVVLGYGVVRGRVTTYGKPAARWGVHTGFVQGGETDADGNYEMPLVSGPGQEWICFGEMARRTIVVSRWGEVITLDVELGDIQVSGRVVNAKTGSPTEGAVVAIVRDGIQNSTRTGASGEFRFEAVAAADCHIEVEVDGFLSFRESLQLFDEGQYVEGRIKDDLVLQLTPKP